MGLLVVLKDLASWQIICSADLATLHWRFPVPQWWGTGNGCSWVCSPWQCLVACQYGANGTLHSGIMLGKKFFIGINVRCSHCNDFALHFCDLDNLTYWTFFVYLLENLNFCLQSSQAGGEYPQLYCAAGLAETHRLFSQISIRRWPSGTCEEEELEEGYKWRRCCWWGRRLDINSVTHELCQ